MKIRVVLKRICLFALLLILVSCATERTNLVKTEQVSLDVAAAKGITVLDADVYQDGDKLIVEGRVRSMHDGHIDITIVGPDGKIIKQARSYYRTRAMTFGPKGIPQMFAHEANFEEIFHIILPEKSTVRLEFH